MGWLEFRLAMLAHLSRSWQLVRERGGTSPDLIEHVLENRPEGQGRVGLWIDRRFLQQPHWQALRSLHVQTKEILSSLARKRARHGLETFVVDLGCGSARYAWDLLDVSTRVSVLCLRRSPKEVELGRAITGGRFGERLVFAIGDRCDPASYLLRREPDVAVCLAPSAWFSKYHDLAVFCSLVFRSLSGGGLFLFGTFALCPRLTRPTSAPFNAEHFAAELEEAGFRPVATNTPTPASVLFEAWKSVRWSGW
ncbi:hypothetical protein HRbin30_01481 [bacterium HR30]|nr:hypothetical protein HRbin30_01481 [bacterium HR30]